jgi:hypothetical protein
VNENLGFKTCVNKGFYVRLWKLSCQNRPCKTKIFQKFGVGKGMNSHLRAGVKRNFGKLPADLGCQTQILNYQGVGSNLA